MLILPHPPLQPNWTHIINIIIIVFNFLITFRILLSKLWLSALKSFSKLGFGYANSQGYTGVYTYLSIYLTVNAIIYNHF